MYSPSNHHVYSRIASHILPTNDDPQDGELLHTIKCWKSFNKTQLLLLSSFLKGSR